MIYIHYYNLLRLERRAPPVAEDEAKHHRNVDAQVDEREAEDNRKRYVVALLLNQRACDPLAAVRVHDERLAHHLYEHVLHHASICRIVTRVRVHDERLAHHLYEYIFCEI